MANMMTTQPPRSFLERKRERERAAATAAPLSRGADATSDATGPRHILDSSPVSFSANISGIDSPTTAHRARPDQTKPSGMDDSESFTSQSPHQPHRRIAHHRSAMSLSSVNSPSSLTHLPSNTPSPLPLPRDWASIPRGSPLGPLSSSPFTPGGPSQAAASGHRPLPSALSNSSTLSSPTFPVQATTDTRKRPLPAPGPSTLAHANSSASSHQGSNSSMSRRQSLPVLDFGLPSGSASYVGGSIATVASPAVQPLQTILSQSSSTKPLPQQLHHHCTSPVVPTLPTITPLSLPPRRSQTMPLNTLPDDFQAGDVLVSAPIVASSDAHALQTSKWRPSASALPSISEPPRASSSAPLPGDDRLSDTVTSTKSVDRFRGFSPAISASPAALGGSLGSNARNGTTRRPLPRPPPPRSTTAPVSSMAGDFGPQRASISPRPDVNSLVWRPAEVNSFGINAVPHVADRPAGHTQTPLVELGVERVALNEKVLEHQSAKEDTASTAGNPPSPTISITVPSICEPEVSDSAPRISVTDTTRMISICEPAARPSAPSISVSFPSISLPENSVESDAGDVTISVPSIFVPGDDDETKTSNAQPSVSAAGSDATTSAALATPADVSNGAIICAGCEDIIIGRILSAAGKRWHPACYLCTSCQTPLEFVSSFENDNKPYCHLCYHEVSRQ